MVRYRKDLHFATPPWGWELELMRAEGPSISPRNSVVLHSTDNSVFRAGKGPRGCWIIQALPTWTAPWCAYASGSDRNFSSLVSSCPYSKCRQVHHMVVHQILFLASANSIQSPCQEIESTLQGQSLRRPLLSNSKRSLSKLPGHVNQSTEEHYWQHFMHLSRNKLSLIFVTQYRRF